ncbi:hypothetical protein HYH03_008461 [Edaphochlamys debaryana]|uniref:SMP-30/Gluconolactonase/LRE-like region domain-containing protein n=1 Tax=Edaphochlamys debaryana TaxID=47281 RepID=A0A835Y398_9CHLO|nr:hypothetical protein HYH03_008461 [Edaphochlamys debaryana]|eukprot:KAG2493326.1 hypothetical protein HYH03_008461 [Edaphochlamys debaryana]
MALLLRRAAAAPARRRRRLLLLLAAAAAALCTVGPLLLPSGAAAAATAGAAAGGGGVPWDLGSMRLCSFFKFKEMWDNASGVAYMPETGTLWVIDNNPPALYEYDTSGRMLRKLGMGWLKDPEDVVYVSKDLLAVSEENEDGGIRLIDVSPGGGGRQVAYIPAKNPRWGGAGNEGLTLDRTTGTYYVAQEKGPKRIVAIKPHPAAANAAKGATNGGASGGASGGADWWEVIDGDRAYPDVGDLAAITYVPQLGQMFVLSQESNRVIRSTMDGRVLQELPIKGHRPEGMDFTPDGRTMFIVSEPNELAIYRVGGCLEGDNGGGDGGGSNGGGGSGSVGSSRNGSGAGAATLPPQRGWLRIRRAGEQDKK